MANPNIVAVATINGGNAGWNLTAGLTDTLLTVSGSDVIVKLNRIVCTNVDGSSAYDLNLFIDGMGTAAANGLTPNAADTTVYIAKTISIPADASLVVSDTPIYLMEGDSLKGGGSTVNKLDLFISYEVLDDA